MPYSSNVFDNKVEIILNGIKPKSLLDLGAGAGKYGKIAKQVDANITTIGVEIDPVYIHAYKLEKIYDVVKYWDIEEFIFDQCTNASYDVVIMGDVLEHMRKSKGVDIISFLLYHCKVLLILTPRVYIQNTWVDINGQEHKQEAHLSAWRKEDFAGMNFEYEEKDNIQLFMIKGFIS